MIILLMLTASLSHFFLNSVENILFELWSETLRRTTADSLKESGEGICAP